jgi:hypothetical protein
LGGRKAWGFEGENGLAEGAGFGWEWVQVEGPERRGELLADKLALACDDEMEEMAEGFTELAPRNGLVALVESS